MIASRRAEPLIYCNGIVPYPLEIAEPSRSYILLNTSAYSDVFEDVDMTEWSWYVKLNHDNSERCCQRVAILPDPRNSFERLRRAFCSRNFSMALFMLSIVFA